MAWKVSSKLETPGLDVLCLRFNTNFLQNGLGTTSQIAIRPRNAKFSEAFDWRFSVSELAASCSFSVFPGYSK